MPLGHKGTPARGGPGLSPPSREGTKSPPAPRSRKPWATPDVAPLPSLLHAGRCDDGPEIQEPDPEPGGVGGGHPLRFAAPSTTHNNLCGNLSKK